MGQVLASHREETGCVGQCLMTLRGNLVRSKPGLTCPDVFKSLERQYVGETLSIIVLGHLEGTLLYPEALGKKSGKLGLWVGGRPKLITNNQLLDTVLLYVCT